MGLGKIGPDRQHAILYDGPLAMVRIAVAVAIVGVAVLGDGLNGFAVKNLRAVRILNRQLTYAFKAESHAFFRMRIEIIVEVA
jgi:hypothetical protein